MIDAVGLLSVSIGDVIDDTVDIKPAGTDEWYNVPVAALAATKNGGWKPIETRPEDGEFLAWDPVSGKQDVCQSILKMRIVDGKACYDVPSCAAVQQDSEYGPDEDEFQGHRATHWMPLSSPPDHAEEPS